MKLQSKEDVMEKKRFDRDKNVHEQFLKMNSDIRYELMEIVKSAFLPWVKDGYAIPVRHFMYDGLCSSCYALFVKNENDEIWITPTCRTLRPSGASRQKAGKCLPCP